jgi:hypothetical protein
MDCPNFEEKKHRVTMFCCGMLSFTGLTTGIVTALTIGSTCGTGYLLLGGVSATSLVIIRKMKISKDLEDSVVLLQSENDVLKENNKQLELISESLQSDVEIISESVKMVGESTQDFMRKLKTNYEKLKQENDRHQILNRQQAMIQLMQLFKHFDADNDFSLNDEELRQNEIYLKSLFPNYTPELFDGNVTYSDLCDALLPK